MGMKRFLDSSFARDAALLVICNGLAGLLFMLVHAVAGRMMAPEDYSGLFALLGLTWITLVPSSALQIAVARYASEYCHTSETELWTKLFRSVIRLVTKWGLPVLGVWCLAAPWVAPWLNAASPVSYMLVGLIGFVSLYGPVVNGALQGARRFGWMAAAGMAPAVTRIALVAAICWAGGRVSAVLVGFAVSIAAGILAGWWPLRKMLTKETGGLALDLRQFQAFFWPVAAGQLLLYVFMNADIILMRRFLAGEEFAIYGKVSALSRMVLFAPLPIVLAMFPRAVVSRDAKILWGTIGTTLGIGSALALVIFAVPDLVMQVMYGVKSPLVAGLLRPYVWAAVPLMMTTVLAQYLWARHEARALLWIGPVAAAYVVALFLFHATALQMIACLAAGNAVALAVMGVLTARSVRRLAP